MGGGERGLPAPALAGLPQRVDKVILLLLDAFGWRFFEQYREQSPFLGRFVSEGVVSKLTSQFPSTTAAHATTIHTGLPVGQSGVYEWFYYEPAVDGIIAPLLFSFPGSNFPGTLPVRAAAIFPQETFYQRLREQGVKSSNLRRGNPYL